MRNFIKRSVEFICLISIFKCLFADRAYAYIDLGSGSYFFQVLIAAIFGIFFTAKVYWKKIKDFLDHYFLKNKDKNRE